MPELIDSLKLSEIFASLKPSHVLGTTYTLSLTFFESVVWPYIDKSKLKRCLILCDQFGYHQAMFEAASLRHASTSYMALPVFSKGSFHPKVWMLSDGNKTALLVGSGNLTQSGFIDNTELFSAIMLDHGNLAGSLANDIQRFLQGVAGLLDNSSESGHFAQLVINELSQLLPAGDPNISGPRLYTSFQGSLPVNLAEHGFGGDLFIASPYFGGDTAGLNILVENLLPQRTEVYPAVIDGDKLDVDLASVKKMGINDIGLLALTEVKKGFPHLKLYGHVSTGDASWLYCGSANCTKAALSGQPGDNIEAGLVHMVSPDVVRRYFTPSSDELAATQRLVRENESSEDPKHFAVLASFLGDNVIIRLPEHTLLATPLIDVVITIRAGSRRFSLLRNKIFETDSREKITLRDFEGFTPTPFAAHHIEIRGKSAHGAAVESSCLIDDIVALTASALERGACRAASQAMRGEMPELADMLEYFNLIDNAIENGVDFDAIGSGNTQQPPANTPEERIKIPLWPPRPVTGTGMTGHGATHGSSSIYFWLDKIVGLFVEKHPIHHVRHIVETETGDPDDSDKKSDDSKNINALISRWNKAEEYTERLKSRLSSIDFDIKKAQVAYAAICSLHVMRLSLRGQAEKLFNDSDKADKGLPSVTKIARDIVDALFHKRYDASGRCRKSVADACTLEFNVPLYRQFALLAIAAFCEISENTPGDHTHGFPINAWLDFKSVCSSFLETYLEDVDSVWSVYNQHFAIRNDQITKDEIASTLRLLSKIGWSDHHGYMASQYLYKYATGIKAESPESILDMEEVANFSKFKMRVERGLTAVVAAKEGQEICLEERCPQRFVVQAVIRRKISITEPVICPACGVAIIPGQLYKLLESEYK